MPHLPDPFDLFAAEVQYWRLDPKHWRRILEAAADAGLPGVSSYVPWEVHEIEKGRFDFDGSTDPRRNLIRYLDLVRDVGLKLAYRPGPFVCNEMAWGGHPRRIVLGNADMMVWQADNTPAPGYILQRREGWQPSYLHPAYLDEVRTWLGAVDAVARDFTAPHGGPIATCNLDNELSYIVRDSMFGADYNPCVVGPGGFYHQWLEAVYHTTDALPYRQSFPTFADVHPPRALGDDLQTNLPWYFDWIRFKEWLLPQYLRTLRQMHEEFGLQGVHFYTNLNPHRPEGIPTNFRTYADATGGLVGYDFYRSPWLSYSGYASISRVLKLMRASLPFAWSAEFMGGWWFADMAGHRVPRSHTELMSLAAMANGCQAISWFMFHDRYAWGDAPVSEMGHRRENHDALTHILAIPRALDQWNHLVPQTDLAIAYYRPYMWHSHLGDPAPCADNDLHIGDPILWETPAGAAVAEYEGLFRITQQAGYTPAAIDLADAPHDLPSHPLVWLAAEPFLDQATATHLQRYVRDGGILILSLAWPTVDPAGNPALFLGLADPPKAQETPHGFAIRQMGEGKLIWRQAPIASVEPGQEPIQAVAAVRELLHQLIGPPLVDVATAPVTIRHSSEGMRTEGDAEHHNLVDAILHEGSGHRVLYLVNLHLRAVQAHLTFRHPLDGQLEEVAATAQPIPIQAGRATVDIDRKSTRVFHIHPSDKP